MSLKWFGDDVYLRITDGTNNNLNDAGTLLRDEVKRAISVPGRSVTNVTTKTGKTRKKYGKKGEFVSKPGEPPRKQSGRLYRSVKKRLFRKLGFVRVSDRGNLQEYGTVNQAARPHLRATLARISSQLADILTRPIR